MSAIGFKKNVKPADLINFIQRDLYEYAIIEYLDSIIFDRLENISNEQFNASVKGRIFGNNAELKWQRRGKEYHLVIIADDGNLMINNFEKYPCKSIKILPYKDHEGKPIEHSIFLWGEKDRDIQGWFEPRIPQILSFPVDFDEKKKRVKIVVQEYEIEEEHSDTKEIVICRVYRFKDLIQDIEEPKK